MKWRHLIRRDCEPNIINFPYDWLHLHVVDPIQGFDHHQLILLPFVLLNYRLDWRKMFLVADVDVVQ
jgi:hypothetical protein